MSSKRTFKVISLVILSFAAYYLLFLNFESIKLSLDKVTQQGLISYILTYFIIGIPIFAGTWIIDKTNNIFISLGLSAGFLTATWISVLFTIPMFMGGVAFFQFNPKIGIENLIAGTLVAGFMEELYFRGFLFGLLYRKTKLGFIPCILFGAVIFAVGHLYQSQDMSELIGIFLVTFSGAVFFAWLYVEWNYNLWVPILTHTFMNLSWQLFEIDHSALGGMSANIFRGLTILTSIVFTIAYKRKRSQKLAIHKPTLFMKSKHL